LKLTDCLLLALKEINNFIANYLHPYQFPIIGCTKHRTMLKIIGLLAFVVGLIACFQPQIVQDVLGESTEEPMRDQVLDAKQRGLDSEEYTTYAAGYDEDDFGAAFAAPVAEKFPIEEATPPTGPWAALLELKFKIYFDEDVDDVIFEPRFSEPIRAYEGKTIEVEGFIIPHDIAADAMGDETDRGDRFMFSAFPLASCFFCGGAGAESVMEATPKEPISYTERRVTLRGRLEFNTTDPMQLPYLLKDVELVQ